MAKEQSMDSTRNQQQQYQAICSEVDVIMKTICEELGNTTANKMNLYTPVILSQWANIKAQKVKVLDMELQPFINWEQDPNYQSPD